MMCDHREPELLLLAHKELPLLRAVTLRMHLSRCSQCRERYRRLAGVSMVLASALRAPGSPPWTPAHVSLAFPSLSKRNVIFWCALLGVSALLLYGVMRNLSQRQQNGASQRNNVLDKGCSPGLPNDRCR